MEFTMKKDKTTLPLETAPRREELNYFNAIACLFVILIHVLSVAINTGEHSSNVIAFVYIPWKFAAYVVPGFLFVGAVKMAMGFDSKREKSYIPYVWRRVTKIYVPYVITVCVYFAYFWYIGWYVADPMLLLRSIFVGDIASPFYYVVTVMQFYLLMPLWRYVTKHIPFFVSIPVAMLITIASIRLGDILNVYGISFMGSDRIFTSYIVFWIIGLYVGANYSKIYSVIMKHQTALLMCSVPAILFSFLIYWQYRTRNFIYIADANCMKLISDILSIMCFMCLCIIIKNSKAKRTKALLRWIFGASFSVYLSHCLFLNLADRYIIEKFSITDLALKLVIRFVVCYTLPFLWYWLLKKVKYPIKKLFHKKKAN